MNDIHALSGAYAVDALDDAERAEFERHLAVCADCRAEVASFRETTALLAEPEAETPPASLRAHVLSGIQAVRPLPPVPGNAGNVTTLRRRHLPGREAGHAGGQRRPRRRRCPACPWDRGLCPPASAQTLRNRAGPGFFPRRSTPRIGNSSQPRPTVP